MIHRVAVLGQCVSKDFLARLSSKLNLACPGHPLFWDDRAVRWGHALIGHDCAPLISSSDNLI
jgi:hypothetical protein